MTARSATSPTLTWSDEMMAVESEASGDELHGRGLRYRLHQRVVPGKGRRRVDITFPRARVAVFVDGCFWHGCDQHGRRRHEVNGWYWPAKIEGNRERDRDTDERLTEAGWLVIRVWEHEPPESAASRIEVAVRARTEVDPVRNSSPRRNPANAEKTLHELGHSRDTITELKQRGVL
jgi:DNA mismatch endonuclease, patch repair protein